MNLPLNRLLISIFFFIGLGIHETNGANILVTVMGIAGSQNLVMYRLAEIMGQRGHNVTILKGEVFPEAKSAKLKYSKEIVYSVVPDEKTLNEIRAGVNSMQWSTDDKEPLPIKKMLTLFRSIRMSCEHLLDNEKPLLDKLKNSNFDVIVIHLLDFCAFGLTQTWGVESYVWMSTAPLLDFMTWYTGSPLSRNFVPGITSTNDPMGVMSFFERIKNIFGSAMLIGVFQYGIVQSYTDLFRQRFGSDFPHYNEIIRKTQLYFSNTDPFFEFAQPLTANVISIGGVTMEKPEALDESWQKIMDNAPPEGVVIFSLGSICNTTGMPQHIRMAFLNAFKRFPQLFIWRFEGDFPEANTVKNVRLAKWLPQKDLMAHPKVKAAIIHGGYNSLTEITYMGIPVIVLPLWGDQFTNVARVQRQNIGVSLDRKALTEQNVVDALNKVLYDKNIRSNATRVGQMIRERPMGSYKQATEWLEFLAKFKTLNQLQPISQELSIFTNFYLDVIAFFVAVLVLVFIIFKLIFKLICRLCCRKSTDEKNQKGKKKKE